MLPNSEGNGHKLTQYNLYPLAEWHGHRPEKYNYASHYLMPDLKLAYLQAKEKKKKNLILTTHFTFRELLEHADTLRTEG